MVEESTGKEKIPHTGKFSCVIFVEFSVRLKNVDLSIHLSEHESTEIKIAVT
jgi:hypothetical protein